MNIIDLYFFNIIVNWDIDHFSRIFVMFWIENLKVLIDNYIWYVNKLETLQEN